MRGFDVVVFDESDRVQKKRLITFYAGNELLIAISANVPKIAAPICG